MHFLIYLCKAGPFFFLVDRRIAWYHAGVILKQLELQAYRSFPTAKWDFLPGRNVIVAPNGTGKSNIIEAVRWLSTADSWRAGASDEVVRWGEELARVRGVVVSHAQSDLGESSTSSHLEVGGANDVNANASDAAADDDAAAADDDDESELEVLLTRGVVQGRRTSKKLVRVNGVGKQKATFIGRLPTVLFVPEDMDVFIGSPSGRRRLLDSVLAQVSREYRRSLTTYEQALRRRNKLILGLREGTADRFAFFYWDQLLIEHGAVIHNERARFLEWLSAQSQWRDRYRLHYDHSIMSEARLHQYAQAEVGAGHTLVGPHRDDWQMQIWRAGEWRPVAQFGSRGEQRMALVWWKLGEMAYLRTKLEKEPVVLLDDVLSELDAENGTYLLEHLGQSQSLITATANHWPTLSPLAANTIWLESSSEKMGVV